MFRLKYNYKMYLYNYFDAIFVTLQSGATSTVLHVAVESRQPAILHVLLTYLMANYGTADGKGSLTQLVNATDKHGSTPTHVAAGVGCTVCSSYSMF